MSEKLMSEKGERMAKFRCKACNVVFEYSLPPKINKNKKAKVSLVLSMIRNGTIDKSAIEQNSHGYVISVNLHYSKLKPHCPVCLKNNNVAWIYKK